MSIKLKKKICKECGKNTYIFSKGRCKSCASKSYKKPAKVSSKKKEAIKERQDKLSPFFEYHEQEIAKNPVCDNCGCKITNDYRWSCAHILPKSIYKEVEDEMENCVYLCIYPNGCHTIYDSIQNTEEVYKMPVWKKVFKKYLVFKEKITTFGKALKIFQNYEEKNK